MKLETIGDFRRLSDANLERLIRAGMAERRRRHEEGGLARAEAARFGRPSPTAKSRARRHAAGRGEGTETRTMRDRFGTQPVCGCTQQLKAEVEAKAAEEHLKAPTYE
jgi:hypothetical protein